MREERVDSVLVTDPHNVFYLTDFPVEGNVVLTQEKDFLVVSPIWDNIAEDSMADLEGWEVLVHTGGLHESLPKVLGKKTARVGFEASTISYSQYRELSKAKGVELVPCRGWVEELRMVKDSRELDRIEQAVKVASAAVEYMRAQLREGISEKELAREVACFIRMRSEGESFPTIVLFGERTALPHGTPSDRKLGENEVVLVDLGTTMGGYCSDLTRTFLFGEGQARWQDIINMLLEVQERVIEEIRPGVSSARIEELWKQMVGSSGYGKGILHRGGHGVGIQVHEGPFLGSTPAQVLKEGMVVAIEPGVYFAGEGGARVEEMVVVTENASRTIS